MYILNIESLPNFDWFKSYDIVKLWFIDMPTFPSGGVSTGPTVTVQIFGYSNIFKYVLMNICLCQKIHLT